MARCEDKDVFPMSHDNIAGGMSHWHSPVQPQLMSILLGVGFLACGLSLGGVLGGCSVVQPPSAAAEAERISLRIINVSPNSPPLSVGVGESFQLGSVMFGGIGEYARLPGGRYEIDILAPHSPRPMVAMDPASGVQVLAPAESAERIPVNSFWADLTTEGSFTILAVDEVSRISAIILRDGQRPVFDRALVRFVHAVPDAPTLKWVDASPNPSQAEGVVIESMAFGSVSNYVELQPGFQSLSLQAATQNPIPSSADLPGSFSVESGIRQPTSPGQEFSRFNFDVRPNRVYTVFVTGLLRGSPGLDIVLSDETDVNQAL